MNKVLMSVVAYFAAAIASQAQFVAEQPNIAPASGARNSILREQTYAVPANGHEPYIETETQIIQVDSSTIRTEKRFFTGDGNGEKKLVRMREEEVRGLPYGGSKSIRNTLDVDLNGNAQQVEQEIIETNKIDVDVAETITTVWRPNINGGSLPILQIDRREHYLDGTIEFQEIKQARDGNGNWHIVELHRGVSIGEGSNHVVWVSPSGSEGNLNEASERVSNGSQDRSTENRQPKPHLIEAPATTSGGSRSMAGRMLQSRSARFGKGAKDMAQVRDTNRASGVVWIDLSGSNANPAVQVQLGSAGSAPETVLTERVTNSGSAGDTVIRGQAGQPVPMRGKTVQ